MRLYNFYPRQGFSLVELSIVLVILGLLTGGILAGRSLIRASELRQMTNQVTAVETSFAAFRDKYLALPGDMANATAFWGAANTAGAGGNCSNSLINSGSGTQTCNGNGDGRISGPEAYRYWQHLANAGLWEGTYSGVAGSNPGTGGYEDVLGENLPMVKGSSNGGLKITSITASTLASFFSFGDEAEGHFLRLAECCHQDSHTIDRGFLLNQDSWQVDTKTDDGKPYYGRFRVMKGYWSGCTTAMTVTAEYMLTGSGKCSLYRRIGS